MLWESEAAVGESLVNHYIQLWLGWVTVPRAAKKVINSFSVKPKTSDKWYTSSAWECVCLWIYVQACTHALCTVQLSLRAIVQWRLSVACSSSVAAVWYSPAARLQAAGSQELCEASSSSGPFRTIHFRVYNCVGRYIFTIWGTVHNLTFHSVFGYEFKFSLKCILQLRVQGLWDQCSYRVSDLLSVFYLMLHTLAI